MKSISTSFTIRKPGALGQPQLALAIQSRTSHNTLLPLAMSPGVFAMRATCRAVLVLAGLIAGLGMALPERAAPTPVHEVRACTFSIAAYDADRKEWGVATASRVLAVGNCVPWAKT